MAKNAIDAEALKKHQFWIGLGVFAVLWIVAVIMVKISASDEKQKAWEKAEKEIKAAMSAGPKTEAYQLPWKEHGKKFQNHKDVIWKDAWEQQKDMYTWPESMPFNARPLYIDDPFARDAAGNVNITADLNNRNAFRTDWYAEQFFGLDQYVFPAEFNGGFFSVFPMQVWDRSAAPTREEIWLAQEDFWVRREMLFMIRNAIDSVALFKEITPKAKTPEKLPEGVVVKKIFRNANWELTLLFKKSTDSRALVISDQSTIKNINPAQRTQVLAHPKTNKGLPFRLIQDRSVAEIRIAGEPLAYNAETALKQVYSVSPVDPTRTFYVEQVLDWALSPIRRIDVLDLGRHSHRTVIAGLKVNEELKKLDPDPQASEGEGGGSGGGGGSGPAGGGMMGGSGSGPPPGMMGPGMQGGRGGAAAGDTTKVNAINRERYLHVTPQCKHLPIGLRLVVDQSHIHDILAAIANSRLRVQITQVTLHHASDVQRAAAGGAPGGGAGGGTGPGMGGSGPPPGMGMPSGGSGGRPGGLAGGTLPMGSGGGPPPGMIGPRPGGMTGFPSGRPYIPGVSGRGMPEPGGMGSDPASSTSTFQDNARLIELSIYGIASLYERFPPRVKPAGDGTGTTNP